MHRVVTVAQEGSLLLDVAIPAHVFGYHGTGRYEHKLATSRTKTVQTSTGVALSADGGPSLLSDADTIVVTGYVDVARRPADRLLGELRDAAHRGARLVSICTGAFTLAWAGLLDGRRATTHWAVSSVFAELFPAVDLDPAVLYVDDGPVLTSAGVAAGLDLCLHIVRADHGAAVAAEIARHTVIAPHRNGGQAQFIPQPILEQDSSLALTPTMAWALDHLDESIDLSRLARRAGMSTRTFARHFRYETGTTPLQWLLTQRIAAAQRLLETTQLPVETVAHRCGFTSAAHLRKHFSRLTATTPGAYRTTFAPRAPSDQSTEAVEGEP